jgi:hypothetical protein
MPHHTLMPATSSGGCRMTSTISAFDRVLDHALGRAAERAAWAFYAIATLGSSIGQIWVGVQTPPWPPTLPLWVRALLALPFAVVIDLGGVVTSGFADTRRRLGENAYGWRILSAGSVTLAVGINVVGHAKSPYLATVFGGLGIFTYTVWLLHTSARRRDALRVSGKMSATPPAYGLSQWRPEPAVTRRDKSLALEFGYGLHESLTEARSQLRAERRRTALASHIDTMIQARHDKDPVLGLGPGDRRGDPAAADRSTCPPVARARKRCSGSAVLAEHGRSAANPHPAGRLRPMAGDLASHQP